MLPFVEFLSAELTGQSHLVGHGRCHLGSAETVDAESCESWKAFVGHCRSISRHLGNRCGTEADETASPRSARLEMVQTGLIPTRLYLSQPILHEGEYEMEASLYCGVPSLP